MDTSQAGIDLIKKFEGFFEHAYRCPAGVWTIGYGTIRWDLKRPVKEGETITKDEAERQLRREVQRVEDAIDASVKVSLTQSQFDALVSWGYNVGVGWITGIGHTQASLIKELNKGRYAAVPGYLMQFCKTVNGKRLKGLENRRKAECRMWLTTDDENEVNEMPQAVVPETKPITTAVKNAAKESPSFWAAIVGFVTYIANIFSDSSAPVSDATQKLEPFTALFNTLKINMGTITTVVILGVVATVAIRKVLEKRRAL